MEDLFLEGDDALKNTHISKGPWIVKKVVGE